MMIVTLIILVFLMNLLFMLMSYKKLMDSETASAYECGFSLISYTRMFFSFRFFLVCILFLIFDVEIVLMLPIPYLILGPSSGLIIFFFIFVLVLGLMYEYFYGSLNWLNFISKA